MRQITFDITALVVTLMVLVGYSSSQSCSPANNSEGMIIPNTDLPTTGKYIAALHYACLPQQVKLYCDKLSCIPSTYVDFPNFQE